MYLANTCVCNFNDLECPHLSAPINGGINHFVNGSIIVFGCDDEYTLNGKDTLNCINAAWDSSPPTCISG